MQRESTRRLAELGGSQPDLQSTQRRRPEPTEPHPSGGGSDTQGVRRPPVQLEHIEAIEKRLWTAADTLRANSNYASNEYFLPVMGLVFLRHAYSRYLAVKDAIDAGLPTRGGKKRALTKEDFSQKSAIFLRPEAQFDYLVGLPDGEDRAKALIRAMESIENDYESLRGVLPKSEYQELDNAVLGQLLRTLNPDELKLVSGDIFGRIYEYFLTRFADQKAHDGGEFFTPISLVSLIAHVLDPDRGTLLDPACGSGGMFVQSARIVEEHGQSPASRLTFRGMEKNATTIRLAKMNLAVHGLEGDIQPAITYYEDPHELVGKADYVMANPPFNVDEIDADKVRTDPRLPFGLPGVNKKDKVSNGNYVWISYFYNYLNEKGRAGFVMSSQASSAGGAEAQLRRKLIETGDVDVMIAIRSNFFYIRTVPCELWFLNRNKPEQHHDKVLMIDARNVYRQVTRKIYDFSPEQEQNLLAIVWLYRGEIDKYRDLVIRYCRLSLEAARQLQPVHDFRTAMENLANVCNVEDLPDQDASPQTLKQELVRENDRFADDLEKFSESARSVTADFETSATPFKPLSSHLTLQDAARDLEKQADLLYKLAGRLIETCENQCNAGSSEAWNSRDVACARKVADEAREHAVEQLRQMDYFCGQARWLTEHFPQEELRDVAGLVKLVDRSEIAANDWTLTPSRYVGVAPENDAGFDFEEALRSIHIDLDGLNEEAAELASQIARNFQELEN